MLSDGPQLASPHSSRTGDRGAPSGATTFSGTTAILAAPLIAGNDLTSMSASTKSILTNTEVIAVDQDPLGKQGTLVATPQTGLQIWSKTLTGSNARAVALFNRNGSPADITVSFTQIGLSNGQATVRDLWQHADLGSFNGSYTAANVPSHGVAMLRITQ
jgi:alpha-galactosidase